MESLPPYMDESYFDAIYTILDDDAFRRVKELALKEGLLVGSSSGAAFHAALLEAEQAKEGTNIVVIFPDSSERYLSKTFTKVGCNVRRKRNSFMAALREMPIQVLYPFRFIK